MIDLKSGKLYMAKKKKNKKKIFIRKIKRDFPPEGISFLTTSEYLIGTD